MHDILLHFPPGDVPSFPDVQERLRGSEAVGRFFSEEHSTPEQVILVDRDTGTFAVLTPGAPPPEEDEEEDAAMDALLFQIPYLRPRFFAKEAAGWARAIASELGCSLEDPGGADIEASWEAGNRTAVSEAGEPPEEGAPPPEQPRVVPAAITAAAFEHNVRVAGILETTHNIEVPRLAMASLPMRTDPALVGRYTAGDPVWLPDAATHLVLERQKKTWLGTRREEVLVEADAVRAILAPHERAGEAPPGMRAYHPTLGPADPAWQALTGKPARELAVLDWANVVDG